MAYQVKIDGNAVETIESNSITGTPYGLATRTYGNTKWYSVAYCHLYIINNVSYYTYGTLGQQITYTQNANILLNTPSATGLPYTKHYRATSTNSSLTNAVGLRSISSGTLFDANGTAHSLSIEYKATYGKVTIQKALGTSVSTISTQTPTSSSFSYTAPSDSTGWVLTGVEFNGSDLPYSSSRKYTVNVGSADSTLLFKYTQAYVIKISKDFKISSVSISYNGFGGRKSSSVSLNVPKDYTFTVSAVAKSGYTIGIGSFRSEAYGTFDGNGSSNSSIDLVATKSGTISLTGASYSITVSINNAQSSWGTATVNNTELKTNTTYTFSFSSTHPYEPTVRQWTVNGTAISGNSYTTGSSLSDNLNVVCWLNQNAFPINVTQPLNGTCSVTRKSVSGGSNISPNYYLRTNQTDYITIDTTPNKGYKLESLNVSNLVRYFAGGVNAYRLESANIGVVSATFTSLRKINIELGDHPEWGSVTLIEGANSNTTFTLIEGTVYNFSFTSSRENQEDPVVDYWTVNGDRVTSPSYTATGSEVSDVTVRCFLRQRAWLTTVTNVNPDYGSVSVKRYNANTKTELTNYGYLHIDRSDYIVVTAIPNANFRAIESTRTSLDTYSAAGASFAYVLSSTPPISGITPAVTFDFAANYNISIALNNNTAWGDVWIYKGITGTTRAKSFVLEEGETYRFVFNSTRQNYEDPFCSWKINNINFNYSQLTYSSATYPSDIVVTGILTQRAWPVNVSAGNNGSVSWTRFNADNTKPANTNYLHKDQSDYLLLTVTPSNHYKALSPISSYVNQSGNKWTLKDTIAAGASASILYNFVQSECQIVPTLPTGEMGGKCTVSPAVAWMNYDQPESTIINVYCDIKPEYAGLYRVDSWTIGGVKTSGTETMSETRFYYPVTRLQVGNNTTLVCVPNLVLTSNKLIVEKKGATDFGTVYLAINEGIEQNIGASYNNAVKENIKVVIRCVAKFGGKINQMTYNGFTPISQQDKRLEFQMPSNDCSVTVNIAEQDKADLTVSVVNDTDPTITEGFGVVNLSATQSADVDETFASSTGRTVKIYKDTAYWLNATNDDPLYVFVGWSIDGVLQDNETTRISLNTNMDAVSYVAHYALRQIGTIDIGYFIKQGDQDLAAELPEDCGFGIAIKTPKDSTGENDGWVIGASKKISFTITEGITYEDSQFFYWQPFRVDVKNLDNEQDVYRTVWSFNSRNPEMLSGEFIMSGNMSVKMVYIKTIQEGYTMVQGRFMPGNGEGQGSLTMYSTQMLGYAQIGGEAQAGCIRGKPVTVNASVRPGFAFAGWFTESEGAKVPVVSDEEVTVSGTKLHINELDANGRKYFAEFMPVENNFKAWNASVDNKQYVWRSKVYMGAQYLTLRNVRIYADEYPVELHILTASSPNDCNSQTARKIQVSIRNQSPHHLPVVRLDKFFAFEVVASTRITHVALSSSMEGLK